MGCFDCNGIEIRKGDVCSNHGDEVRYTVAEVHYGCKTPHGDVCDWVSFEPKPGYPRPWERCGELAVMRRQVAIQPYLIVETAEIVERYREEHPGSCLGGYVDYLYKLAGGRPCKEEQR